MKPEGQVRHKLVQVRFRHLKREIRGGLSRRPQNCVHNGVVSSPSGPLGVCLKGSESPSSWEGSPCDDRYGGDARAAKCPHFSCSRTKEDLRSGFDGFLSDSSLPEIAERFPDMAALMWVLEESSPPPASEDDPDEPSSSDESESETSPIEPDSEPESEPEPDSESEDRPELVPFRPPTWKLLLVSTLMYVQGRIDAILEAMRRG